MPLGNQPSEPVLGDMSIDLSGGNVGMAQHLLDAAEVRAMVDQVRGEGVPEHMGREPPGIDADLGRQLFQRLGEALAGQVP